MNFIYLFYNIDDELLYVGETDNLPRRIDQHMDEDNWKIKETAKIFYATCKKETDRKLYEIYYINNLKPKYNSKDVMNDNSLLTLPNLEFRELNLMNYQKLKLIIKNEKRNNKIFTKNIINSNIIHINDFNLLDRQILTEYEKAIFSFHDMSFKLKYNKGTTNIDLDDFLNMLYGNTNDLKKDKFILCNQDFEFSIAYQLYLASTMNEKVNLSIKINNGPYEDIISYIENDLDNIVIHLNKQLLRKIYEIKSRV